MPTKKLPSPEVYGKTLAERRRKADRVPQILGKLDRIAEHLAEQVQEVQNLPLVAIQEALTELADTVGAIPEPQGLTDDDRRAIQAIEGMQETIIKALNALGDAIARMPGPAPVPKPTNLEPLMREIRGYRLHPLPTPAPEEKAVVLPQAYEFDSITRDENGDITGARVVPVTRH